MSEQIDDQGCITSKHRLGRPDIFTVTQICRALPEPNNLIQCSDGALTVLLGKGKHNPEYPNVALLYIIAHELAHVLHNDLGDFKESTTQIDLSSTPEEKWETLRAISASRSAAQAEQRLREDRADSQALRVLKLALVNPPFNRSGETEAGWLVTAANVSFLNDSAQRLMKWDPQFSKRPDSEMFDTDLGVSDNEYAATLTCKILQRASGMQILPVIDPSHAEPSLRIADAAKKLWTATREEARAAKPEGVLALFGGIVALGSKFYSDAHVRQAMFVTIRKIRFFEFVSILKARCPTVQPCIDIQH